MTAPLQPRVTVSRADIVAAARGWLGTPYVHQASAKGQGADCLGLIRGLFRELYGAEPELPPPYTPDWNERRPADEPLLSAARRHLVEAEFRPSPACGRGWRGAAEPGEGSALLDHPRSFPRTRESSAGSPLARGRALRAHSPHPRPLSRKRERGEISFGPGAVLIFRIVTTGPAKHCGVVSDDAHFIHAYAGRAVIVSALTRFWTTRIAGVFEFPGVEE